VNASHETRIALDADDLEHLLRGGPLKAPGVAVALQDIGWTEIRRRMVAACSEQQCCPQDRTPRHCSSVGRIA
jgi:hypothetical protein